MEVKKRVQWHPAFAQALQIELEEESENLEFEEEHLLGSKPMQIDVLVVKKVRDIAIQKNIGRIFRKHNIIEYKSPEDFFSINDFYKVYGYACFYQSDTEKTGAISPEELTITIVCNQYPRKAIKHFSHICNEYEKHKQSKKYEAAMNAIMHGNWEKMKEAKNMCDAIKELFAEELEELEAVKKEKDAIEKDRENLACLISAMGDAGETEQIPRLLEDESFLQQMLEKYHIK